MVSSDTRGACTAGHRRASNATTPAAATPAPSTTNTTTLVVYPFFLMGKRLGMSGVVPISSSEPITLDRVTTPDEPFAAIPDAKTIALRVAASLAVLIGVLAVVGKVLISTQLASGLRSWDESVSSWLATNRSDELIDIARSFSKMADTRPILAMMAVVTIALGTYRRWRAMLFVPIAMLVEISTFLAVNYLVRQPRPDVVKIGPIPKTYSFPSGHVAATLVCWIGAAFLLMAFGRVVAARPSRQSGRWSRR